MTSDRSQPFFVVICLETCYRHNSFTKEKTRTCRCHPHYQFPNDWDICITHSPKHWSTEKIKLQYIDNIVNPYVKAVRERLNCSSAALVIIDNFKAQITTSCVSLLGSYNIHTCLLPPNTTDRFGPLTFQSISLSRIFFEENLMNGMLLRLSSSYGGEAKRK